MTDLDQAKRYLTLLDPHAKAFTFQTIGEGKAKGVGDLARVRHGSLEGLAEELVALNNNGAGVFVTVNETDGNGRKKENITRIRAVWNDDDGTYPGGCPLLPNIMVETSPHRHHHYWLFDGELSPAQFRAIMRTMVAEYGCDRNATDITRVMRLPGFYHNKAEPQLVELINWDENRYGASELVHLFAPEPSSNNDTRTTSVQETPLAATVQWPEEKERIREALTSISSANRDAWFRFGGAIHDASGGTNDGFQIWDEWSRTTTAKNYNSGEQHEYWNTHFKNARMVRTSIRSIYAEARKALQRERDARIAQPTDLPTIDRLAPDVLEVLKSLKPIDPQSYDPKQVGQPTWDMLTPMTMACLKNRFKGYGHEPTPEHWRGLRQIAKVIERMAEGTEEKSLFVSFLPAGMGKTTTLAEAIRVLVNLKALMRFNAPKNLEWIRASVSQRKYAHVGVIVFLSRLEEIRKLVAEMGLGPDDFSVIASEGKEENKLGRQDDKTLAQVLFTTQKGLEARSSGGAAFADMKPLFYRGKPRQVRVWDEAILPSRTHTLSRFEVQRLLDGLSKGGYGHVAKALDEYSRNLLSADGSSLVQMPELGIDRDEALSLFDGERDQHIVESLFELGGRMLRVHADNVGNTALGYEDSLPKDIAPMLILDASGQQRKTYELWYKGRSGIKFLVSPQKTYKGLTIHHWNVGSGRTAHMQGKWKIIAEGVAKTIDQDIPLHDDVLVIHFQKGNRIPDMTVEISKRVLGDSNRIKFCNWGRETATNDYCNIKHVILAGVPHYPPALYEATARGAKGSRTEERTDQKDIDDTRLGEVAHRILQAANRGMVRKSVGAGCPEGCHLYAAFHTHETKGIPKAILNRIFPRARVTSWRPISEAKGRVKELLELLEEMGDGESVTIAEIARRLEMPDPRNVRKLLKHHDLETALRQSGTHLTHSRGKVQIHRQEQRTDPLSAEAVRPPEEVYESAEES